jgi:hypothetical protein
MLYTGSCGHYKGPYFYKLYNGQFESQLYAHVFVKSNIIGSLACKFIVCFQNALIEIDTPVL